MTENLLPAINEALSALRPLRAPVDAQPDDHLFDDLGLDSLDRVTVVLCLEERFGVAISDGVVARVRTVGDLVRAVEGKN